MDQEAAIELLDRTNEEWLGGDRARAIELRGSTGRGRQVADPTWGRVLRRNGPRGAGRRLDAPASARQHSREAFVTALQQVVSLDPDAEAEAAPGDGPAAGSRRPSTRREVIALLGEADRILDPYRKGRAEWLVYLPLGSGEKLLCYGSERRNPFPTLGAVRVNEKGQVTGVFGAARVPRPPQGVEEATLRRALRLLSRLEPPWSHLCDPAVLLGVANQLVALGEETAIAAILEFVRINALVPGPFEGAVGFVSPYLLMSVLYGCFEFPPDTFFGPDRLVVVEDVPPVLGGAPAAIRGQVGFGLEAIRHYQARGRFRQTPLVPPDDSVRVMERLRQGLEARHPALDFQASRWEAVYQLLRLVRPVYQPGRRLALHGWLPAEAWEDRWTRIRHELRALPLRWNRKRNRYLRARR